MTAVCISCQQDDPLSLVIKHSQINFIFFFESSSWSDTGEVKKLHFSSSPDLTLLFALQPGEQIQTHCFSRTTKRARSLCCSSTAS